MATTAQRQAITSAEILATILDNQLDVIGLLALQPVIQRRADLIAELHDAADDLIRARQIVFAWRHQIQQDAANLNP